MPKGITIRQDYDAGALRRLAGRCRDANQSRRLLALAAVYDGMSGTEAAKIGGMDRQTLRDWVHRFNAEGLDGLLNRSALGRARWLNPAPMDELADIVETGPDPEIDGVVRWRRIDLKRVIEEHFGVVYAERSISRLLADLGGLSSFFSTFSLTKPTSGKSAGKPRQLTVEEPDSDPEPGQAPQKSTSPTSSNISLNAPSGAWQRVRYAFTKGSRLERKSNLAPAVGFSGIEAFSPQRACLTP